MRDYYFFLHSCIFFNTSSSEQEKEDLISLILETCRQIEEKNVADIDKVLDNVEFIVYKPIEGNNELDNQISSPDGGVTIKSCWRCFIIYYPLKRFQHRETQLYILAHEFAHAFYKHPITKPCPMRSELEKFDHEADAKAVEWGFKPHKDDENDTYRKYFDQKS
jgi:hypothetical protein